MNVQEIEITTIKVRDGKRQRSDPGDVKALADSIDKYGLIQPIVLDPEGYLIAGGRRVAAHIHLGRTTIPFITKDQLDPIALKELELEENLQRENLTWQDEVRAMRDLMQMRQARFGKATQGRPSAATAALMGEPDKGYGNQNLADELNKAYGTVVMDITLANGLDKYPELNQEKTKSSAFKRLKRLEETAYRQELARRNTETPVISSTAETNGEDATAGTTRQPIRKAVWKGRGILYHADARDVLRVYEPNSIDCIVCDPPYALGLFKEGQATGGARLAENQGTMYDDDPQVIMDMLDEVFFHASKLLKPDGHAYVFFHMTRYEPIYLMLRKHFGNRGDTNHPAIEETPIVWIKNTPGIGDPNRNWVYAYEPCFFINRGRQLQTPQAFNYLKYDTVQKDKIHPTEKPVQLLRHLITASCVKGEVVLDMFAGSGSTLVAADQVG